MLGAASAPLAAGYVLSALAAAANGSFAALSKLPSVAAAAAPPAAFQLYASLGVVLSSLACAPPLCAYANRWATLDAEAPQTTSLMLSGNGVLAGVLFAVAISGTFAAIPLVGLGTAQSVWGGVAVLVSFAWGVAALGNRVESPVLAALGLACLVASIAGIAACAEVGDFAARRLGYAGPRGVHQYERIGERAPSTSAGVGAPTAPSAAPSAEGLTAAAFEVEAPAPAAAPAPGQRALGLAYSLLVGVSDGSILVPMHFETRAVGFAFLPSFGLGALAASLVVAAGIACKEGGVPDIKVRQTAWAGVCSGVLWNVGNGLSIAAIPRLGYAVAYPLLQCSLLVGGLWGVFCFGEIRGGPPIAAFFAASCVLIAGAGMLGASTSPQ